MSSEYLNKKQADQEVQEGTGQTSTDSTGTNYQVQTNNQDNQVGCKETSDIEDSQGEVMKSERWSSVAEPYTSFRQVYDELSTTEPALGEANEAAGDASCLSQVGAVFQTQSGKRNRGRSPVPHQPGQPDSTDTSGNDETRDGSLQRPHTQNGSA